MHKCFLFLLYLSEPNTITPNMCPIVGLFGHLGKSSSAWREWLCMIHEDFMHIEWIIYDWLLYEDNCLGMSHLGCRYWSLISLWCLSIKLGIAPIHMWSLFPLYLSAPNSIIPNILSNCGFISFWARMFKHIRGSGGAWRHYKRGWYARSSFILNEVPMIDIFAKNTLSSHFL